MSFFSLDLDPNLFAINALLLLVELVMLSFCAGKSYSLIV